MSIFQCVIRYLLLVCYTLRFFIGTLKGGCALKSLLELLYEGELFPFEQISVRGDRYREVCNQVADSMNQWQERLSAEQFQQLEQLLSLRSQVGDMEMSASFVYGFKLGAGLMKEMIDGRDELLRGKVKNEEQPLPADNEMG